MYTFILFDHLFYLIQRDSVYNVDKYEEAKKKFEINTRGKPYNHDDSPHDHSEWLIDHAEYQSYFKYYSLNSTYNSYCKYYSLNSSYNSYCKYYSLNSTYNSYCKYYSLNIVLTIRLIHTVSKVPLGEVEQQILSFHCFFFNFRTLLQGHTISINRKLLLRYLRVHLIR